VYLKEEDPPSAVGGLGRFSFCGRVRRLLKRPTQRSGWAYIFSVCGAELKVVLNPSAPNTPEGNTLDE
jgi:hypothetical protein